MICLKVQEFEEQKTDYANVSKQENLKNITMPQTIKKNFSTNKNDFKKPNIEIKNMNFNSRYFTPYITDENMIIN